MHRFFDIWYKNLNFDEMNKIVNEFPVDFLRGIYESDGCLIFYKNSPSIVITNVNKNTVLLTNKALTNLGFKIRKPYLRIPKEPRKPIWVFGIGGKKLVKSFLDMIKPVIKNTHKDLKTLYET